MIIISDTSPISGLIIIGKLDLLPRVYGKVVVPSAVVAEIEELARFGFDLNEFQHASWLEIKDPANDALEQKLRLELDEGEAAAIALAVELAPVCLAIDEKKGRQVAESLGIEITGLVGILIEAKAMDLIKKVRPILDELRSRAGFRISDTFYHQIINMIGEQE